MNYRHGFHAGNFADLAKHAVLLAWLRALREGAPFLVIDSHAGAGLYDLSDESFSRSKEAEAGIKALLGAEVPAGLKPLADYVRAKNAKAGFLDRVGLYPGSPLLVLDHLRTGDAYLGCELRDDDYDLLKARVVPRGRATQDDGYKVAVDAAADEKDLFFLIDPPFERPDDYARIVETLSSVLQKRPDARALVWLPLKDLETLDAFLRRLERYRLDLSPQPAIAVAELRLRSLWNPMKMNGCALVAVNAPDQVVTQMQTLATDVVAVFGEADGLARTYHL